jgi:hypothetical protein
MRHHTLRLTLVILVAGSVVGQTRTPALERGKIEELKGLTKVFVMSPGRDQSLARRVTQTIQKKLHGLNFVTSPTDAEIWLWVYAGTRTESGRTPPNLNVPPNPYGDGQTRLSSEQVLAVRGSVTILGAGKRRLILEFSKTDGGKNLMADQFAKEFVRVYEKAMANP